MQVFVREKAGRTGKGQFITSASSPYPLALVLLPSPKERRCQDATPFLLWEVPGQLFLALEEEK